MAEPVIDLVALKYAAERRRTATERLDRARVALRGEEARRRQLARQLRVERQDVKRLERMSFASFVAALRGMRDERLQAEREEYLQAKLSYDGCEASIRALTAQMLEVEREVASLDGAEERYAAALEEREGHLLAADASTRDHLLPVVEALGALRAEARELEEAEAAGQAAETALAEVSSLLEKAEGWGTFDLLGGGMITTALKHDRLDQARHAAHHAGQALRWLGTELSQARIQAVELGVDIGDFVGFADFWMDGMIADWLVQDRIEQAARRVMSARRAVHALRQRVYVDRGRVAAQIVELEEQRRRHLEAV